MAVNKNFVVKNGIEVNTNLIVADTDSNKVGIGTTVPEYTLHVFEGTGIGASMVYVTGISTSLEEFNVGVGGTTFTAISNAAAGIAGSVGVGTDLPGYLLEVHAPVSTGQTALFVRGDMHVTGDINLDDITLNELKVTGISTFEDSIFVGSGATVGLNTVHFADHAKAMFGDGEDLQIYHDGNHSYIDDSGTGDLYIRGDNALKIQNAAGTEQKIVANTNGSVDLYYDNTKRFETNAIGVEVSGTFQSTGITTLASGGGISTTGGDLFIGGDLFVSDNITLDTNLNILGIATIATLRVSDTATGESGTEALIVGTGLSVRGSSTGVAVTLAGAGGITTTGGDLFVGGDLHISEDVILDTNLEIIGIATIGTLQVSSTSGINTISSTVQSSSKDTGALVIEGGVGIEKNLFVGGGAEVTGITTITGTLDANGALDVDGHTELDDVNVAGASTFTGAADFNGAVDIDGHTELDDVNVSGTATITTFNVGTAGQSGLVGITTILDEDNMASDSATALATQQSIKAYVDTQITAEDLDFGGDSGTGAVDLDSQTFTIAGTSNEIETSASGQTLTIGLPNFVTVSNGLNVTGNGSTTTTLNVSGVSTFSDTLEIPSDSKKILLGAGKEMQVFHDGTDSLIKDTRNSGSVKIQADNFSVIDKDASETMLSAAVDGAVSLSFNGSTKFKTTGAGVTVTGVGTFSQSISIASSVYHLGDDDTHFGFPAADTFTVYTAGSERVRISSNGRVAVGNATNNASPTALFGVIADDGEADELYVGKFHNLEATAGRSYGVDIRAGSSSADHGLRVKNRANDTTQFLVRGDGKVGINTNDPQGTLQINDGLNGLEFNVNSNDAVVAYNRTTSSYLPVGLQGSSVQLRIGGTGTILDANADGTITTGIATFSSTSHIKVPVGTTAQRPSGVAGDFRYNSTLGQFEGYTNAWGAIGGGGGGGGITTSHQEVQSTSATGISTFSTTTFRSAHMLVGITQGTSYQTGRYLIIHDNTTPTILEESALATGDMLGTFDATIAGGNLTVRVTMGNAGLATVAVKMDTINSDSSS